MESPQERMPEPPPPRRGISWALAVVLIVLILALLGGFVLYRVETFPMRAAAQVRNVFGELGHFQPRISIHDRVLFEQTTSTLELVVVSRETQVEREIEHQWLGSKRRLVLRGTYQVRAGFDLRRPFTVHIEGRRVSVELPPPKILGVDQISVEVGHFENGLWNKFNPTDVVEEVSTLPMLARAKASEAGLQKEALDRFTQQLREKVGPAYELEIHVTPSGSTPP